MTGEAPHARHARAEPSTALRAPRHDACSVGELRTELTATLVAAGIRAARDEARDLIAALLDVPRFWPSMHSADRVKPELRERVRVAAARRASGAPFAYAVGRTAFRHLTLLVDERVLIPRQETEQLVQLVLDAGLAPGGIAIDVATGSGAVALALASESRFARVIGTDISLDALSIARANVDRLAPGLVSPVELASGSFLAPAAWLLGAERARAIVSNPPYIAYAEREALPTSVRDWEPPLALFAADDGMAAIRAIARDAATLLEPDGLLAIEVDERRASLAAASVSDQGAYRGVQIHLDLAGRERFVLARRAR